MIPPQDLTWPQTIGQAVQKYQEDGGLIFVNGGFTAIGTTPVQTFGSIDATTNAVSAYYLGSSTMGTFCVYNGAYYFSDGLVVKALVLATGLPIPGFIGVFCSGGPGAQIKCLKVFNGKLYVGGQFDQVNGIPHTCLVEVDPLTGAVSPWDAGISVFTGGPAVVAMDFSGNTVYTTGYFGTVQTLSRNHAAAFDLSSGAVLPWDPNLATGGTCILCAYGNVYIGGAFAALNGGSVSRKFLAAVDALTGSALPFNADLNQVGTALDEVCLGPDNTILLGGQFDSSHGLARLGFAQVDRTSGIPTDIEISCYYDYYGAVTGLLYYDNAIYIATSHAYGPDPAWFNRKFFLPPPPPPVAGIPMPPVISWLLRKDGQTLLKWQPAIFDVDHNRITVSGYRVYRSTNANLETFEAIADITTLDVANNVDTMFTELIQGFYAYAVGAFNDAGESEMAIAKQVSSTVDSDLL